MDLKKDQRVNFEIGRHETAVYGPRTILKDFNTEVKLREYLEETKDVDYQSGGYVSWLEKREFITPEIDVDVEYTFGVSRPGDQLEDYKDIVARWKKESDDTGVSARFEIVQFIQYVGDLRRTLPHVLKVTNVFSYQADVVLVISLTGTLVHEDEEYPISLEIHCEGSDIKIDHLRCDLQGLTEVQVKVDRIRGVSITPLVLPIDIHGVRIYHTPKGNL